MQHYSDDTDAERASLSKLAWSPWTNGVVDVFHDPLNLYLMLECIPAGVLHDIIYRRGPLDAATTRFYYANIVCALEFLHGNGIVHRDLKPANILIKPDGYISLVDFGLAKPETDSHTWAMVGTPIYMAPELFMSQAGVGCGVDWWSSGIILYEMVTQRVASILFRMRAAVGSVLFSSHSTGRRRNIFTCVSRTRNTSGREMFALGNRSSQWSRVFSLIKLGIDWVLRSQSRNTPG